MRLFQRICHVVYTVGHLVVNQIDTVGLWAIHADICFTILDRKSIFTNSTITMEVVADGFTRFRNHFTDHVHGFVDGSDEMYAL